jgi:hypothetical protein
MDSPPSPSRRSFLYAAVAAGMTGRAALATKVQVVAQSQREFEFEGCPATEFIVHPQAIGPLSGQGGGAIELLDPVTHSSFLVPLFDLSILTEQKFEAGLKASVQAHSNWHGEQQRAAPPIHIHLIRVAGYPNLRALLVHPTRCVLKQ